MAAILSRPQCVKAIDYPGPEFNADSDSLLVYKDTGQNVYNLKAIFLNVRSSHG